MRFLARLRSLGPCLLGAASLFGVGFATVAPSLRAQEDTPSTPPSEMQPPLAGAGAQEDKTESVYSCLTTFTKVLQLIRQDYVEDDKVNFKDLTYNALRGMLSGLDPHSQFMEPASFKDMQDDTRSRYDGLGLVVSAKDGCADHRLGDGRHPRLEGRTDHRRPDPQDQRDDNREDAAHRRHQRLKGKPGEGITLTILRPVTKEVKDYALTRTEIKVDSVKDAHLRRTRAHRRLQSRLRPDPPVQRADRPGTRRETRRPPEAGHGGAGPRFAQQPRRPAQQRGGRVRPVRAGEHDGGLHRGPHALIAPGLQDRRTTRNRAAIFPWRC